MAQNGAGHRRAAQQGAGIEHGHPGREGRGERVAGAGAVAAGDGGDLRL